MNDLKNKKILIIGGASGFGLQSTKTLLAKGAHVIITSRSEDKLDNVIKELKKSFTNISGLKLDARNYIEYEKFVTSVGKIDYLISMAGSFMGGGFLDADYETIYNAIDDKLFANIKIAKHLAPNINDGGAMVFTAGSGGRADNASGAIIGNESISTMVKGLAIELSKRKIRVNAIAPTWTITPLWDFMSEEDKEGTKEYFSKTIPLGRTATIEEVSSAYIFMLENSFVNGQTLAIDGGLNIL